MGDLDLSDIDPLKWVEVRKRVKVVKDFLTIERPNAVDRQHHAALLRLGVQRFNGLVKAWKHQQAASSMLPGRQLGQQSKSKKGGIDPTAREIAREVIRSSTQDVTLSQLVATVEQKCSTVGISPPSPSALWLLKKESPNQQRNSTKPSVIIGRAFLRLPVVCGEKVILPEAIVIAHQPDGLIIDIIISSNEADVDRDRIVSALQQVSNIKKVIGSSDEVEMLDHDLTVGWDKVTPSNAKRILLTILGKRIGRIKMNYQNMKLAPAAVMESGLDRPLSREDAEEAIRIAIEQHNRQVLG